MKLADLFIGDKQIAENGRSQASSAQNQNTALLNRQINSLIPGQTIRGTMVSRNGSEVQIKISDDMVLTARVDQNIRLEIGQNVTFEVKNNGQTLNLSPLFTNVAADVNVLKALDMAALPVNQTTVSMTEQMMQAGLSIDRNSLQQVFRESTAFPDAETEDIIILHKLSLPVNESNLNQASSYRNLTHQLISGLQEVIGTLPDTVQNLIDTGNIREVAGLYRELLSLLQEERAEIQPEEYPAQQTTGQTGEQIEGLTGEQIKGQQIKAQQIEGWQIEGVQPEGQQIKVQPIEIQQLQHPEDFQKVITGETAVKTASALPERQQDVLLSQINKEMTVLSDDITQMSETILPGKDNWQAESRGVTLPEQISKLLTQGLDEQNTGLLQRLLANKELKGILQDRLEQLWTIRPEEVADPEKVEQLYNRLIRQLKTLSQALETVDQTGSASYKAVTNLTQNLDFLQQLNQTYTYIQLPLRLQQGNTAHGELHVYTNKKHMASGDGKVSALLHLDMEHLGPVDVYVALQQEKVSTKFYVQDEEMLVFLEKHMELLTRRLKQRGYDCSCNMELRDRKTEETEGIKPFLQAGSHVPVVQYAFDVRT